MSWTPTQFKKREDQTAYYTYSTVTKINGDEVILSAATMDALERIWYEVTDYIFFDKEIVERAVVASPGFHDREQMQSTTVRESPETRQ